MRLNFSPVFRVFGLCAAICLAASATPVLAGFASDQKACEDDQTDPDARITVCTRWLKSSRLTAFGRSVAYQNRGFAWEAKGDLDKAIADFTRALEANTSWTHYNQRGLAWQNKGDLDKALADYTRAIELDSGAVAPLINRGNIWDSKKDYEKAIEDYNAALRINPDLLLAVRNRALTWQHKGDLQRALEDFDQALRMEPDNSLSHWQRANALVEKGDFDAAIADYNFTLKAEPTFSAGFNQRALAYVQKGDLDRAMTDYDEALRLDPKNLQATFNRGDAWRRKGDLDRALADFNAALAINPQSALALAYRGRSFIEKGDLDRAIADFDEALRQASDFQLAFAYRGRAYEQKDEAEKARADYSAALGSTGVYDSAKEAKDLARVRLAALQQSDSKPQQSVVAQDPVIAQNAVIGDPGRRVALIIGNSAYQAVPMLPNPKRDAETFAAALRQSGFQVVRLEIDSSRNAMIAALQTFAAEVENADWAVLYFAGHGLEIGGTNYLVPIDARLTADRDVQFEAISLDQVLASVEGAKKLRVVLLDACRDNPFAAQMRRTVATRSIGRGLARVEPAGGTLLVYAAKEGQVALDGDGANSPFVAALVGRLTTPGLEIRRLFDLVRDDVMDATNGRQQPFTYGSVTGREDFFFVTPN